MKERKRITDPMFPAIEHVDGQVGGLIAGTEIGVISVMSHVNAGIDPRLSYPDLTVVQIEAVKEYADFCRRESEQD